MIEVEGLICRLNQRHTLRVPDLRLKAGQCWTLFGGNGAGKSALAAALCGQLVLGRSQVHYADGIDPGRDVAVVSFAAQQQLRERDRRLDMSEYAASAHDPGTTVAALVGAERAVDEDLLALVSALGLEDLLQQGIRFLSSGQMRRVMLARALSRRPRVLVLDEPLEAIDRDSRRRISELLARWCTAERLVIVLTRRLADIVPATTHLALLDQLSLVMAGPWPLLGQQSEFRQRSFLAAVSLPPLPVDQSAADAVPKGVPLIDLRDVSLRYGDRLIVRSLNWQLWPGQHVLLEGPNGSGKSTLLGLISGDNHMAYGQQVSLFGRRRGSGETVWQIKAHFGVVSNELHGRYLRGWRVLDVVLSGFFDSEGLYQVPGDAQSQQARAWLVVFGLAHLAAEPYHALSFGQQRMVLLARAMVKQPRILLLDEPCVGLDDRYLQLMLAAVDAIAASGNTQLIYVTHGDEVVPRCLNQRLRFVPQGDGSARVEFDDWPPRHDQA